jgi:hypothetical protein
MPSDGSGSGQHHSSGDMGSGSSGGSWGSQHYNFRTSSFGASATGRPLKVLRWIKWILGAATAIVVVSALAASDLLAPLPGWFPDWMVLGTLFLVGCLAFFIGFNITVIVVVAFKLIVALAVIGTFIGALWIILSESGTLP